MGMLNATKEIEKLHSSSRAFVVLIRQSYRGDRAATSAGKAWDIADAVWLGGEHDVNWGMREARLLLAHVKDGLTESKESEEILRKLLILLHRKHQGMFDALGLLRDGDYTIEDIVDNKEGLIAYYSEEVGISGEENA